MFNRRPKKAPTYNPVWICKNLDHSPLDNHIVYQYVSRHKARISKKKGGWYLYEENREASSR